MRDRIRETKRRISRLIDQLESHLIPPSLSLSSHQSSTITTDRASKVVIIKGRPSKKKKKSSSSSSSLIKRFTKLVGSKLRVEIFDRRTFEGRLICLDDSADSSMNLVLDQTIESVPGLRSRHVGLIFIPIDYILSFEINPRPSIMMLTNDNHLLLRSSQVSLIDSGAIDPCATTHSIMIIRNEGPIHPKSTNQYHQNHYQRRSLISNDP